MDDKSIPLQRNSLDSNSVLSMNKGGALRFPSPISKHKIMDLNPKYKDSIVFLPQIGSKMQGVSGGIATGGDKD